MKKRLNILGGILFLICILGLAGCKKEAKKEVSENIKPATIEEINKKLKKENGVKDSKIYINDNEINVDISLKESTTRENAEKIANIYGEKLKKGYKNKYVNINVTKSNKRIIKEKSSPKDNELTGEVRVFFNKMYVQIRLGNIDKNNIKQVLLNDRILKKGQEYEISDDILKIIIPDNKSKINILVGNKKYDIILF
ncbi:hypothetical protein Z957_11140 [Clostridium sp. K25]|uniref:hypothetical protein n=1 Tax=Clostridium sp. K25 TaxID=1443109 RepID=UPI0004D5A8DF|nr:hypothetical protein [Clostridium sp. K25]KEI06424.1 hypothetical protein Z957_11140 [Clostridium sp. K25]